MKAFVLAGVVGIMSLWALAPTQANAAEPQSNNDTVAVRWHGHRGYYGGAYYYAPRYYGGYNYPSYYGSYYTPYNYNYYSPSYYSPGYSSSYYYPNYRYYRPGFGVYLGL